MIAFSGLLLLTHRPGAGTRVLAVWGAAMLMGAGGLLLASMAGRFMTPLGVPFDIIGTLLLLLATATSWTAARLFRERRPIPWAIAAGPALWAFVQVWHAGSPHWAALSSAIGAVYLLATAYELTKTRPEPLPSRAPAIALLVLHTLVFAAHAVGLLLVGGPPSPDIVGIMLLEGLLHTNAMAFLLLAMVKERLEIRTNEQLRALTRLDGLTGIGNRRHFDEQLDVEIRRATRRGPTLALLLIDVDHFKAFNDAVGHQQGDACLREVAQTIAGLVRRPGDLAARYGGEEFAVVMANTDPDGALMLANRMCKAVAGLAVPHPATRGVVTISIGVALLMRDGGRLGAADLVRLADQALYQAKASGRNTVRAAWLQPDGLAAG